MAPQDKGIAAAQVTLQDQVVQFYINGNSYKLTAEVPPTSTLLEYLRNFASLPGTKGCCYEGGCGVCTVVTTFVDHETQKEKTCSVRSCQTFVYSCAGWVIETIEHLGNRYKGYHSLQKALVGFYGTQCGYCSPGFIMTMYGELKSRGTLTTEQVEKSLDGNLCRCTGYRPILDAFKSLAVDAPESLSKKLIDIEDSYNASCPKTGELCKGQCGDDTSKNEGGECPGKVFAQSISPITDIKLAVDGIQWHRPATLNGVYETLQMASRKQTVKIVVGNTGSGVYKDDDPFNIYLDTAGVADLYAVTLGTPLVIGANVSLQRCIEVFKQMATDHAAEYDHLRNLANHWEMCANLAVRNVGCWAGNIMLKHKHKEFPSDLFVTLAIADAVIKVGHSADASVSEVNVEELMNLDMEGNFIISMTLPSQKKDTIIRTIKIAPRRVNAHAYVTSAFKFKLDSADGFRILSRPSIIYGGISGAFVHAKETEYFLINRRLGVISVLKEALNLLGQELKPDSRPQDSSPEYRISLAQSLFYKVVLNIMGSSVSPEVRSGGSMLQRPISSGSQSYDPNTKTWPIGQAIPKIESNIQVSGEAEYLDDVEPTRGELHGAFVQTEVAKAEVAIVSLEEARKIPGFVDFVNAIDIPGVNSFYRHGDDPVFVTTKVNYAGQSLGLIVAETKAIALRAAKKVKVTYINVEKPVLNIRDATRIQKDLPPPEPIKPAAHTLDGVIEQGNQFHFSMETLAARVVPMEDGYDVYSTTQWLEETQAAVAGVLGIKSNSINMFVRRLGGAFGGKITRQNLVACAAAVASHKLQKPVRIALDLKTHMTLVGWRDAYLNKYKVSFEGDGTLKYVEINLFGDCGFNSNEAPATYSGRSARNVYFADKMKLRGGAVNTDTAANTYCRTPGIPNATSTMENILERVAYFLKEDPALIRERNFIDKTNPDKTFSSRWPKGENLIRTNIFPLLKEKADYVARRADIEAFNKANRWRKKGISMLPVYFQVNFPKSFRFYAHVTIYAQDGTVIISHAGIEMGQGLNTKAVQVASRVLSVPMDLIKVKPTNLVTGANSAVTGGSMGSDIIAYAVQKCCEELKAKTDVIEIALEKRRKKKPTWKEVVRAASHQGVDLSAKCWTSTDYQPEGYDVFAAACMEVEVDVLTGQYIMSRADIIEDTGRSLSPFVDVGQVEGAFVMGLGLWTTEEVKYDPQTGQKVSTGTWDYKIPTALDIPVDFRVTLLPKGDNKFGVARSKTTGEPPLCLSYCVVTALRQAIASAREDAGDTDWFEINTPVTVERVQRLCKVDPSHFVLKTEREAKMEHVEEDFHFVHKEDVPQVDEASCVVH